MANCCSVAKRGLAESGRNSRYGFLSEEQTRRMQHGPQKESKEDKQLPLCTQSLYN